MNNYMLADEEDPKLKEDLMAGTSQQMAPMPIQPPAPAVNSPMPSNLPPIQVPAVPQAPPPQLPGMPPGVRPDDLAGYLNKQKQGLNKYGPEEQMALQKSLENRRNSLGYKITDAGKGFADALMQGVARAGNPGFQQQFENEENRHGQESLDTLQKAREANRQNVQGNMSMDMMNPSSDISKAYRESFSPIFSKMGYSPKEVAKMSASQVSTVADLGVRFSDAQTQLELKKAMMGVEVLKTQAGIQNQQSERKQEALKSLKDMPWYSRAFHPGISKSLKEESGLNEKSPEESFLKTATNPKTGQRIGTKDGKTWTPMP